MMKFVRVLFLFIMVTVLNVAASQEAPIDPMPSLSLTPSTPSKSPDLISRDSIPALTLVPQAVSESQELPDAQEKIPTGPPPLRRFGPQKAPGTMPLYELSSDEKKLQNLEEASTRIKWADEQGGQLAETTILSTPSKAIKKKERFYRGQRAKIEVSVADCLSDSGYIRSVTQGLNNLQKEIERLLEGSVFPKKYSDELVAIMKELDDYERHIDSWFDSALSNFSKEIFNLNQSVRNIENRMRYIKDEVLIKRGRATR